MEGGRERENERAEYDIHKITELQEVNSDFSQCLQRKQLYIFVNGELCVKSIIDNCQDQFGLFAQLILHLNVYITCM